MSGVDRIETQKRFSIEDCKIHPNKYYIFGDNLVHKGTGGQAIIRHCPNAYGIPTKRLPSMEDHAFFSDQHDEFTAVNKRLIRLLIFYHGKTQPTLVFPEDGLGTGRAKLAEKSPLIYKTIKDFLEQNFQLFINP